MKPIKALLVISCLACFHASAQLPQNFPTLTVTTNYAAAVSDGYIFQAINLPTPGVGYYAMIVGNDGNPVWYTELTNACWDFKVLPNGYLHYAQQIHALAYTGGGDVVHQILDDNHNPVESIQAGNGYVAEGHEFQMLPNGHVLLIGYYLTQVDMSQVVSNGNPAAQVSGAILQELDAQRNVVWQWRFWDHYPFTSQWVNSTAAVISEFHVNCAFLDNDGNLVVSTPDWVKKINRQDGEIMWHLGGVENQFTFAGVSQQQGISDFASHDINRLANGDVLLYNNSKFGAPGSSSSAKEYSLDETNKIATLVWEYQPKPGIPGPFQGSAQRLTNGNTFIGWGGLPAVTPAACTEVSGTNVVFQMKFDNTNVVSYRSFKFAYPPSSEALVVSLKELASGNTYTFDGAGVSLSITAGGGGYNILNLTREHYAPVYPLFQGTAPRVLPLRLSLSQSSIQTLNATFNIDAQSLPYSQPTNLTVYYRPTTGRGLFAPQPTTFNPVTQQLSVDLALSSAGSDMGELLVGYPDVADVPYPPLLDEVKNYPGVQAFNVVAPALAEPSATNSVNQAVPVWLSWSPKGFARYYQVQISTDPEFSTNLVSVAFQTDALYVFTNAFPNTTYFYRVKTVNDGGSSAWSTGAFQTVPPAIAITFPNGGEALRRGVSYFVRWTDNLSENVNISLHKGGTFIKSIATNAPGNGAAQWQVGFDLAPGSDYSIQISSVTDDTLAVSSAANFSIVDAPSIVAGSITQLVDAGIQFSITAPGAQQISVLGSSDLLTWQLLQSLPVVNGQAVFLDTTPAPANRFYKLRVP
jgi:hypothetical protein